MKYLLLQLIRAYQFLASPWVGGACRFVPSCSAYAAEAIERHGAAAGSLLAAARLARCHPFGGAGWDPVPERAPLGALRRLLRGGSRGSPAPASGCGCADPAGPAPQAAGACAGHELARPGGERRAAEGGSPATR